MTRFTGKDLVANWVPSAGGTVSLAADRRSFSYNPSGDLVESTAGNDTHKEFLPTLKDTTVSYTGLMPVGGTALEDALKANTFGTLILQPEGTATGKRKYTIPAYAQGAKISFPYDNVVEITCDFQGSGTPTEGVN